MIRILLGSLLLSLAVSANADAADNSMTITINKNQKVFLVTLPSNPTTGYQWTVLKYDKSFLNLTSSKYIAPKNQLIGAGGQMQFTFALIAGKSYPASTRMVFNYHRSWESDSGTLKNVTINFQAEP